MKDEQLDKIENKIDLLASHLSNIYITLAAQHVSLEDHIRRTTQLEEALAPIKSHVDKVQGAIILLGLMTTLLSLLHYLKVL